MRLRLRVTSLSSRRDRKGAATYQAVLELDGSLALAGTSAGTLVVESPVPLPYRLDEVVELVEPV